MDEFEGVKITKLEPASLDARGSVYEWCKGQKGLQVSVFKREKGMPFANHYHKGEDPSKNPEKFFVVSGKVKLMAYNGVTNKSLEAVVDCGTEILIFPDILHTFEALTDVIFLEYRSTPFDKDNPDSYPAETYGEYIKQKKDNKGN